MLVNLDASQSYSNYLDAYKKSIRHLYTGIIQNTLSATEAAFPLLYLMRHFLEIGYKGNIYSLAKTSNLPVGLKNHTHDLPTLHTALKSQFTAVAAAKKMTKVQIKEFNKYHRKLGELVKLFHQIDGQGTAFRYPDPGKKKSSAAPAFSIDLEKTYQLFDEVKELLVYLQEFIVGNLKKFDDPKDWFLAGGIWNDNGTWQDDKKWTDGI